MLFSEQEQVHSIKYADWAADRSQFGLYIFTESGQIVTNIEEDR